MTATVTGYTRIEARQIIVEAHYAQRGRVQSHTNKRRRIYYMGIDVWMGWLTH